MLFLSLIKNKYLFLFLVFSTITLNGQIVLNEIYIRPDGLVATPPNGLIYSGSKDYIELYNKGCTTVNVSGYFLATKQDVGFQRQESRYEFQMYLLRLFHYNY